MFDFCGSDFPKESFHVEVKRSLKHCENRPLETIEKNIETMCYDIL